MYVSPNATQIKAAKVSGYCLEIRNNKQLEIGEQIANMCRDRGFAKSTLCTLSDNTGRP
jgi:hypothetical protein